MDRGKLKLIHFISFILLGLGMLLTLAGCQTLCVTCIGDACNALPAPKIAYRWDEWRVRQGNLQITYPHLNGMKDKTAQENINHALQQKLIPFYHYQQADIHWQETASTGTLSSILLSGSANETGEYSFPVNVGLLLDLETGKILLPKDLFKSDSLSQTKMAALIKENDTDLDLSASPLNSVPEWMGCYLSGDSFIFYFLPNDNSKDFASIRVPVAKAKPYLAISLK